MTVVPDAHHALIAREQTRHRGGRHRIDAEEPTGNMARGAQLSGPRHVDAVIVVWRQIQGCERAADELRGLRIIRAQQRRQAETAALGLQDGGAIEVADLADGAIDGRAYRPGVLRLRPGVGGQFAREEGIEIFIGQRLRLARIAHVGLEAAHEGADQKVLEAAQRNPRQRDERPATRCAAAAGAAGE